MSGDAPIEPGEFTHGVTVVDFGDARVARGMSRRPVSICKHTTLVYDTKERRIWCEDCQSTVEGFDAFLVLVEQFSDAQSIISRKNAEANAAQDHALHLIAAKNLEKHWRGRTMAVPCPHCGGGLLPEDFKSIPGATSADIERARRKRLTSQNSEA